MSAAKAGRTAEVRVLLAAGTDPRAEPDGDGRTALHHAAGNGHEEVAAALVGGGAYPDDTASSSGATPLMWAARNGHSGVVQRLLNLGADHTAVSTGGYFEGKTALEMAEANSKEELAGLLREWAAAHPNAEYDARVTAANEMTKDTCSVADMRAELASNFVTSALIYDALSEEDRATVRSHHSLVPHPNNCFCVVPAMTHRFRWVRRRTK
eukprot:COSAG04_NODE_636_length_11710_cov_63.646973_5_plen_211_part_00